MNSQITSLLRRGDDMVRAPLDQCHGGDGAVQWTEVLDMVDMKERGLKFLHDDILPPGASIGLHCHDDDEEYYYILSGQGIMTLDNNQFDVQAGDCTCVFPGGRHALKNTGDTELRFIVICIRNPPLL